MDRLRITAAWLSLVWVGFVCVGCTGCEKSPEEKVAELRARARARGDSSGDDSLAYGGRAKSSSARYASKPSQDELDALPFVARNESLEKTVSRYRSIPDCVLQVRKSLLPEVWEGIADLEYHSFEQDICRGLFALKNQSAQGCLGLSTTTAVNGCLRRLALLTHNAVHCPKDAFVGGKDVLCLAWASGNLQLCEGASLSAQRTRCRAVLRNATTTCYALGGIEREKCAAEVTRYGALVAKADKSDEALTTRYVLKGKYQLLREREAKHFEIEEAQVAQGLYLRAEGCRYVLELGDVQDLALSSTTLFGKQRATAHLRAYLTQPMQVPAKVPFDPAHVLLEIKFPGHAVASSIVHGSGHLEVLAFEPKQGGKFNAKIQGQIKAEQMVIDVSGELNSFVRDLDHLAKHCHP